jgi:hypothetical protein
MSLGHVAVQPPAIAFYLALQGAGIDAIHERYAALPRCFTHSEQFAVPRRPDGTSEPQTTDRLLKVDRNVVIDVVKAQTLRFADVVVANIENGFPGYGEAYAKACEVWRKASMSVWNQFGAYGLLKPNQRPTMDTAPHDWGETDTDVLDQAIRPTVERHTHIVCEVYPRNIATLSRANQSGRVWAHAQRFWIRRDLVRARLLAGRRPVLVYVTPHYMKPHEGVLIGEMERRLILELIAEANVAGPTYPALWQYVNGPWTAERASGSIAVWLDLWRSIAPAWV